MNFTANPAPYLRKGQQIGAPLPPSNTTATGGQAGTGARQQPGTAPGAPGQPVPVAVTVNITGTCPHCGAEVNHTPANSQVSQGVKSP